MFHNGKYDFWTRIRALSGSRSIRSWSEIFFPTHKTTNLFFLQLPSNSFKQWNDFNANILGARVLVKRVKVLSCFRINLGTLRCMLQPGRVTLTLWKCCSTKVSLFIYLFFKISSALRLNICKKDNQGIPQTGTALYL